MICLFSLQQPASRVPGILFDKWSCRRVKRRGVGHQPQQAGQAPLLHCSRTTYEGHCTTMYIHIQEGSRTISDSLQATALSIYTSSTTNSHAPARSSFTKRRPPYYLGPLVSKDVLSWSSVLFVSPFSPLSFAFFLVFSFFSCVFFSRHPPWACQSIFFVFVVLHPCGS